MGSPLISDEEVVQRVSSNGNSLNKLTPVLVHHKMHDKRRPVGATELSLEERGIVGALATIVGPSAAAEMTGVSTSVASNSKKHITSTDYVDGNQKVSKEQIRDAVETRLTKVRDVALEKLVDSMLEITPDKLKGSKARDLAGIARDLSQVVDKTIPKDDNGGIPHVQVHIFAPQQNTVNNYETVDVGKSDE